jgi:methyl-accepting chemotaxis protein
MFKFLENLKLNVKISLLGVASVIITAVALITMASWQSAEYAALAQKEVDNFVTADQDNITTWLFNLVEFKNEEVQQKIDYNMKVAQYLLINSGGVSLSNEMVTWSATNQLDNQTITVQLPKMLVGGYWLGQNTDPKVTTAIVDQSQQLGGYSTTIFQRMNEKGDMLRVATNVQTTDGKRAIGTYIPAVDANGTPNSVIGYILNGNSYQGRAYVVNTWHLADYEPIKDNAGKVIGMVYVGDEQKKVEEKVRQAILQTKVGPSGYVYVLGSQGDQRGKYIISKDGLRDGESIWDEKDSDGTYIVRDIIARAVTLKRGEWTKMRYRWQNAEDKAPRWVAAKIAYYAPWDWVIGIRYYEDEVQTYQDVLNKGRTQMTSTMSLAGIGLTIFIGLLSIVIAWTIVRPLRQMTKVVETVIQGNFNQTVDIRSQDETGILANAFNQMISRLRILLKLEMEQRQGLEETVSQYVAHMAEVAKGNLAARLEIQHLGKSSDDPLLLLGQQLNATTASLESLIQQVYDATTNLTSASARILSATSEQATGSTQQSAAITQTSSTVEEVKAISEQFINRSQEMTVTAQHSVDVSRSGEQVVAETIDSMDHIKAQVNSIAENILALSERTQQIGDIITTVNEVASQSNILALNAAVEAARAGEHGKGFAVVAVEVRNLAEQSRQATAQVRTILLDIQKAINTTVMVTEEGTKLVEHGVSQAEQSGKVIQQLAGVIDESSLLATQMAASGRQQTTGIEQIAMAMQNIKQATIQGLAATRQTESVARDLSNVAKMLIQTIDKFSIGKHKADTK